MTHIDWDETDAPVAHHIDFVRAATWIGAIVISAFTWIAIFRAIA